MTRAGYDRLLEAHGRFPSALVALIEGTDDELLRSREAPGRWSPLEILVHLHDEEVEDFRPRAQAGAESRPIEHGIDPQGWVVARAYNDADPATVLAAFIAEREDSMTWLRQLDLAVLGSVTSRGNLTMRCGDFIAAWRMHDLLHLRQLTTALARLTARRLDGWKLDYAGQLP